MGVRKKEYQFLSTNGVDTTWAVAYFPSGKARDLIQVVHDVGEHIGRYERELNRLAADGYIAFGHDHMGHGRLAKDGGTLGTFSGENNYLHMIDDVQKIYGLVLADCREQAECRNWIRKNGERSSARPLWEKRQKRYNDYIENPSPNSWRTTSKYELQKFEEDELCGFDYDLYSYRTLLQLEGLFRLPEWVSSYPEFLPVCIMAGLKDPVNNYTREIDKLLQGLRHSDAKNVFYKYYKNSRHDLFFDIEAGQVSRDVIHFLDTVRDQWNRAAALHQAREEK